jgi:hypothetical protein
MPRFVRPTRLPVATHNITPLSARIGLTCRKLACAQLVKRLKIDTVFGNIGTTKVKRFQVVNERIHFISHKRKQILSVDYSKCSAVEVAEISRSVPDYVTTQPRGSVLVLSDFTGASIDQGAIRSIQETAVFNKPYVNKSALVGDANLLEALAQSLRTFSRREFPTFKSRAEALTWLVED